MTETIIIGIVIVVVLGIGSQWLASQIRVPSILLLLIAGFVAGPVLRILPPETLQGDWVLAFVSLSIGIILFEGGLNLRRSELKEVGAPVLRLITVGVVATWVLAAIAAYYLLGFSLGMSAQVGAILTVTGPTVVIPLLRHVRPHGRVGVIAKWEGITIDPVGAILAVLVLETLLLVNQSFVAGDDLSVLALVVHAVQGLFLIVLVSVAISIASAALLIVVLYRRLVPDYLQSSVALMIVVASFGLSNVLQGESGLLQVTIFGIIMANQRWVTLKRITEFKENLQVLLIACLFIMLSARLELSVLQYIDASAIIYLVLIILLVRPAAVFLSTLGLSLTLPEKTFLSWLAPRGIVAAAVASLFAYNLRDIYPDESLRLVPIVFFVIVGTVAVYGLTAGPVARWLGLAESDPQGTIILGAHAWSRSFASILQRLGIDVLLIDTNVYNVEQSKAMGLNAVVANVLSEFEIDELDLGGVGRFFAVTPNDEVNSLAAIHFLEVLESRSVYQLDARPEDSKGPDEGPSILRGRPLFGEDVNFLDIALRFRQGAEFDVIEITDATPFSEVTASYGPDTLLLCIVRAGRLLVQADGETLTPTEGDSVIIIPVHKEDRAIDSDADSITPLVRDAIAIDIERAQSFEEIAADASRRLAEGLPYTANWLTERFMEMAKSGAMAVAEGVAFPHCRVSRLEDPVLGIVRCRSGIEVGRPEDEMDTEVLGGEIFAFFFLVSPEDHPGRHLRTLANLASRVDDENFLTKWKEAEGTQELRRLLAPELREG